MNDLLGVLFIITINFYVYLLLRKIVKCPNDVFLYNSFKNTPTILSKIVLSHNPTWKQNSLNIYLRLRVIFKNESPKNFKGPQYIKLIISSAQRHRQRVLNFFSFRVPFDKSPVNLSYTLDLWEYICSKGGLTLLWFFLWTTAHIFQSFSHQEFPTGGQMEIYSFE